MLQSDGFNGKRRERWLQVVTQRWVFESHFIAACTGTMYLTCSWRKITANKDDDEGEMPSEVLGWDAVSGGCLRQIYGVVSTPTCCYPLLTWLTFRLLGEWFSSLYCWWDIFTSALVDGSSLRLSLTPLQLWLFCQYPPRYLLASNAEHSIVLGVTMEHLTLHVSDMGHTHCQTSLLMLWMPMWLPIRHVGDYWSSCCTSFACSLLVSWNHCQSHSCEVCRLRSSAFCQLMSLDPV